ncbi:hypothetical protein PM082_002084 [Marasmius tenuissimus]|nr:hypothetical protein PM082_002084 [Marasmius tenuissimus]
MLTLYIKSVLQVPVIACMACVDCQTCCGWCSYNPMYPVLYGFSLAYPFALGTFDGPHVIELVRLLPKGLHHTGRTLLKSASLPFHSFN